MHENKEREEQISKEISNLKKMIKNKKKMLINARSKTRMKNHTVIGSEMFKLQ